jgi:hypothetical protein
MKELENGPSKPLILEMMQKQFRNECAKAVINTTIFYLYS